MSTDESALARDELREESWEGAVLLQVQRPSRRNALTPDVARALAAAIRTAGARQDVWAVFLRGAGGHFSVGLDLKWLETHREALSRATLEDGLRTFQDVVRAIVQCTVPVVGVLEGSVAGIGVDIALACDLRIASDTVSIHSAFAKIGLVPDGGSTFTLPRVVGPGHALELLLGGEPVDAARAQAIGLVQHVYPDATLESEVRALAGRLREQSRDSLVAIKRLVRDEERERLERHLAAEGRRQLEALSSSEFRHRLAQFVGRRQTG